VNLNEPSASVPRSGLVLAVVTNPILLTGLYAWGVCVAPALGVALLQLREAPLLSRPGLSLLAGLLSLVALAVGVFLERLRSYFAPFLGIWGFLGLLMVCLLASPSAIDVGKVDPLRGALGSGGFALFALAWGVPDVLRRLVPEDDPRADTSAPLEARGHLSSVALLVAAVGVVSTMGLFVYAWRVVDGPRALFGRALAGLAGVALISVSAEIATGRRDYSPPSPGHRLRRASTTLFLVVVLAGVGVAHTLLQR
jgi:hypothetical protein